MWFVLRLYSADSSFALSSPTSIFVIFYSKMNACRHGEAPGPNDLNVN